MNKDDYTIIPVNGKDNLKKIKPIFEQNTLEGGKNIIVFDADTAATKGGSSNRMAELTTFVDSNAMNVEDIFFFPNNQEDGMFENLIEHLIQYEAHKKGFDCYTDYEKCLGEEY